MVDLHVHSTRSDGTCTPTELVDYAVKKGLTAFALTDHDTVDGLDEAIQYAAGLRAQAEGKKSISHQKDACQAAKPVPEHHPGSSRHMVPDTQIADSGHMFPDNQVPRSKRMISDTQVPDSGHMFPDTQVLGSECMISDTQVPDFGHMFPDNQVLGSERMIPDTQVLGAGHMIQESPLSVSGHTLPEDQPLGFEATCPETAATKFTPIPEVVPGVELSTEYQGKDVHILGLFIDHHNARFLKYLSDFVASRDTRNHKMCALLQETGMDISYEKLLRTFPGSVITRAHYAKYMLAHGYVKSMAEAFERYVGDRCPYYVPREKVTPAQAVELILEAGGVPILAHPILYHMSDARLDRLVGELKEAGLLGIEALYGTYHTCDERWIRSLAKKYDLLVSGGSDFHGDNKPGLDLGTGYGRLCVPEEVLERIRQAHIRSVSPA